MNRQKIYNKNGFHFNPNVFFVSAALILLFMVIGVTFTKEARTVFGEVQDFVTTYFGWFYIVSVGFFLFFSIWLYFSPYGSIRLGPDDSKPDYSLASWFAMLFSAGMGIGLLFYSVAEPLLHFVNPPGGDGETVQAAKDAMKLTFFHWGLHAWGIYTVLGLSLAYFHFRLKQPLSIRTAFFPLLGNRIYGKTGDLIDIFAVIGTLFGIATSLGLGVMQINTGLHYIGLLEISTQNQLVLIAGITAFATLSVMSGLDRGILWLSNLNIVLGFILLLFVFLTGPTLFLIKSFVQNTGYYIQNVVALTFSNQAYLDSAWQKSWTLFYWAWWIAWSPFVGMFVARISRGRTIRQFVAGVLLVPSLVGFFWLTVFGNTALHFELFSHAGLASAVQNSIPTALYALLSHLPLVSLSSILGTIVIATYFITSSDSGSLVIDILTAGGHPDPPLRQRLFWALTEGGVAAVLLVAGGLVALQTAAITTALPLTVILLLTCWGLLKSLRGDPGTYVPDQNEDRSDETKIE